MARIIEHVIYFHFIEIWSIALQAKYKWYNYYISLMQLTLILFVIF